MLLFSTGAVSAQILFSESFNVILDTTKHVKGSITPDFKFQTQKETLVEFENLADLTFRLGKNALTIANKIEYSKYGKEEYLSGGYIYIEYRFVKEKVFIPEFFGQIHWSEARGLEHKYAGGVYGRFRISYKPNFGIFAGIGPFYEYESWNYNGVVDSLIPTNPQTINQETLKLASYVSYKQKITERVNLDISIYYQSRFNRFDLPRLASSSKIGYQLTQHLELVLIYQNIYDYKPIVPIDPWFHRFIASVSVSF